WGFYSPGIACPSGWATATTVSYGMTHSGPLDQLLYRAVSLLVEGEKAAVCCPDNFSLERQYGNGLHCTSLDANVVHTGRMISCSKSQAATTYTSTLSNFNTWISAAPVIQIVWQASDTPPPTTSSVEASTVSSIST
ncbi:hypothetical protein QBC34DRAFT_264023, partial [Podospora aff. communis PSN243]